MTGLVLRYSLLLKDPMKSRDVVPKNVPGVGWGQKQRNLVTEAQHHYLHTTTWQLQIQLQPQT